MALWNAPHYFIYYVKQITILQELFAEEQLLKHLSNNKVVLMRPLGSPLCVRSLSLLILSMIYELFVILLHQDKQSSASRTCCPSFLINQHFLHTLQLVRPAYCTQSDSRNTYLLQMDLNSSGDTAEFYIHSLTLLRTVELPLISLW